MVTHLFYWSTNEQTFEARAGLFVKKITFKKGVDTEVKMSIIILDKERRKINMVYVVIGYDEDWYTFETFMGVFSTKEKAQAIIDNDYDMYGDEKVMNHQEYRIYPIVIDEEFKATEEIFPYEEENE